MNLCLFDLDHTLLPLDSDHAWGDFMISLGWVDASEFKARNDAFYEDYLRGELDIHAYVAYSTGPIQVRSAAERAAAHAAFMREIIEPAIRPEARELVERHRREGDLIALVTATNEFVTAPIAQAFGIDHLIAVSLERGPGDTISGRIAGVPSYQAGKVTRCADWLSQLGREWRDFHRVSVYSDSTNDLPLLERATDAVATNPSPALERIATERGWRILRLFA